MELMYRRTEGSDVREGYLRNFEADFDITTDSTSPTNDFEIKMAMPESANDLLYKENEVSTIVYVDGTEFGGIITGYDIDLRRNSITYSGMTWRGLLSQYIIEPPSGQNYRVVSGDLLTILSNLPMHRSFDIDSEMSYTSSRFQFDRYITTLEGITSLITDIDEDLRIFLRYDEATGNVNFSVAPVNDRTDLMEMSQDYGDRVRLSITYDGSIPKQLICLGAGELAEREVIHLYADDNWNISQSGYGNTYPVQTYDYSGSKNLLKDGKKQFKKLISQHRRIQVFVEGIDLNLSDVIAARELVTGEYATAEITRVIWRCDDYGTYQTESFEYSTKIKTYSIEDGGGKA